MFIAALSTEARRHEDCAGAAGVREARPRVLGDLAIGANRRKIVCETAACR